ncbi:hypothetical protein EYR38_007316 [Pleurotus pulmonarius]|nr:hypothetical protein EYR38_007316 [Pleurotus pulmonarius]
MGNSDNTPKSLADLVFNPKHYSKLLASSAQEGESSPQPDPSQRSPSPQSSRSNGKTPTPVSISDLILNGVTYDAILASSAKKLLFPQATAGNSAGRRWMHRIIANPIPASFMRGGTSKGIFLSRASLPESRAEWDPIFLGIMGSPDPVHGRQLNGMGGGISSLSKICVVGPPSPDKLAEGIHVEYTFVQVGIRDSSIDYSGNCGNLSSMIGVYALDEGFCSASSATIRDGRATIRSFNTNTQKIIDTTFPVSELGVADLDVPEATVAGVPGKASEIILDFVKPGGARTGRLLPTGSPSDTIAIPGLTHSVQVSCVDATNPTIFVRQSDLENTFPINEYYNQSPAAEQVASPILESLRQTCAVRMGLDPTAQAQPKIALLAPPAGAADVDQSVDVTIHALSMGVLHKAVPMTVGLCLGVAAKIPGTIAWDIVQSTRTAKNDDLTRIRHPGGYVDVGAEFDGEGSVLSAKLFGVVYDGVISVSMPPTIILVLKISWRRESSPPLLSIRVPHR